MHVSSDARSLPLPRSIDTTLDLTETNFSFGGHKVCSFIVRLKTSSSRGKIIRANKAIEKKLWLGIVANEIRLASEFKAATVVKRMLTVEGNQVHISSA